MPAAPDARRRQLVLATVCLALFMPMLDNVVVSNALPSISTDLHAGMTVDEKTRAWAWRPAATRAGHQQYRMDDAKPWSWYAPRIDDWAHRLIDPARFDPDAVGHPLI